MQNIANMIAHNPPERTPMIRPAASVSVIAVTLKGFDMAKACQKGKNNQKESGK